MQTTGLQGHRVHRFIAKISPRGRRLWSLAIIPPGSPIVQSSFYEVRIGDLCAQSRAVFPSNDGYPLTEPAVRPAT
jgi:hypothetical protein